MKKAVALLITAAIVSPAFAQAQEKKEEVKTPAAQRPPRPQTATQPAKTSSAQEAAKPAAPAAPPPVKPAPEMQKLTESLAGIWDVQQEFLPSAMMPQGGKGRAMDIIRLGPGGLSLTMDFRGNVPPGFTGHGVVVWSAEERVYKSAWTDNMAPMLLVETGKWEGDKLVFTGESLMNGQKMTDRLIYSDFSKEGFTFTLESGPSGAPIKPVMVFTYKRMGGVVRMKGREKEPMTTEREKK